MEIPSEQLIQIRHQLIEQINSTFPEEKKLETISQIEEMNDEELIEFLKQNNLIKSEQSSANQCIFCSIISGKIPSTKIAENEKAVAILDINPVSEGHTLIIPKEHVSNPNAMPKEAKDLANQVAEILQETFEPQKIEMIDSEATGHHIINVFPIYEDESIESQRKNKTPEDLAELKKKIQEHQAKQKEIPKSEQIPKSITIPELNEKIMWLPNRKP